MRVKNSINNIIYGIGSKLITSLLSFVSRTVLIYTLGKVYLGVNSLMLSIIAALSIAELGIGTAITFILYKPLANEDHEKINIIMAFYKKTYQIIGIIILSLGLILMPFLKQIIVKTQEINQLYIIYIIYLATTVCSYFFTYKRTIVIADQKEYKLTPYLMLFQLIVTGLQIIVLLLFKNYIVYLLSAFVVRFIENIYINRWIGQKYTYLTKIKNAKLENKETNQLKKNIKAIFFHSISSYVTDNTDNLVIASFLSVALVGVYSNYVLLIAIINSFIVAIFNGVTASFGNLIVKETKEKTFEMFLVLNFLSFMMFSFSVTCFYNLFNPFIELWVGESYLLEQKLVLLVVINFYLKGMRMPIGVIKRSAGLYVPDQYAPLIQASINLIVSLLCVKTYGLAGVIFGTLVSQLAVPVWVGAVIIYKYVFKMPAWKYFAKYLEYIIVTVVNVSVSVFLCQKIISQKHIFSIIGRLLICIIVVLTNIIVLYRKTEEFSKIKQMIKGNIRKDKKF